MVTVSKVVVSKSRRKQISGYLSDSNNTLPVNSSSLHQITSLRFNIVFTNIWCWHLSIRTVDSNTKSLAFTKYLIHSQNTKVSRGYYWSNRKKSLSNRDRRLLLYNLNGLHVTKPIQRVTMSVAIEPLCFWEVAKLKTCVTTNLQKLPPPDIHKETNYTSLYTPKYLCIGVCNDTYLNENIFI